MRLSTIVFPTLTALATGLAACPEDKADRPAFVDVSFPESFRFGTAVAQWQVEGDLGDDGRVYDSNWKRWMDMGKSKGAQQNVDGNGFRRQFVDDIARARDLGLDTFRLGLDWSRVEPEPGVFDDAELDHFIVVLDAIRAAGMNPVVTLWHWTVPVWVQQPDPAAEGGAVDRIATTNAAVVDDFERFVRHVVPRIKDRVDTYTVLNEPFSMITLGYIDGRFPPGRTLDVDRATAFGVNLLFMHGAAYAAIKELDDVDADADGAASFVGLTMTANEFTPELVGDPEQERSAASINYAFNDWVMIALTSGDLDVNLDGDITDTDTVPPEGRYLELASTLDFVGIQYYGPGRITDEGLLGQLLADVAPLYGAPLLDVAGYSVGDGALLPSNGMGREISAAGLRDTLDRYAQWGVPMIITENGTTTNGRVPELPEDFEPGDPLPRGDPQEAQAAMYLVEHLWELGRAIADGLDVRAYYHWTLADNYEWVDGRTQRFGAYAVDFDDPTYPRRLTRMGEALRDIVDARAIDQDLWARWTLAAYPTDRRATPRGTTSIDPKNP
ncbi:MAG: glycoside hydrolase family 1 protein [Deltaproteobacteria bacterium]|nr:glycoside hydrolase family 1 protein [Deltaproteobacteria bacterium]